MAGELEQLLGVVRTWAPSAVTTVAAIAINRTLKKHDDLVRKVADHDTRLAVVETRCEERGSC